MASPKSGDLSSGLIDTKSNTHSFALPRPRMVWILALLALNGHSIGLAAKNPASKQRAAVPETTSENPVRKTIPLSITYHDDDDLLITFDGYHGENAALFVDHDVLFCVLDQNIILDAAKTMADITHPPKNKAFFVRRIDQITPSSGSGTVLALSLTGRIGGVLIQKPKGLGLHLVNNPIPAPGELSMARAGSSPNDFKVSLPGDGAVIEWESPQTGHAYGAVPAPSMGVLQAHHQRDFTLLKTVQGAAFKKYRDDLTVSRGPGWMMISGDGVGYVSDFSKKSYLPPLSVSFLNLPADTNPPQSFFDEWTARRQEIAALPTQNRLPKRLDTARFLLKHRLALESSAMLSDAIYESPRAFLNPEVRALKAVSLALSGRPFMAHRVLSYFNDKDDPDLTLWQGYTDLKRGHIAAGIETITAHDAILKSYPPSLGTSILLDSAEGARDLKRPGSWFLDAVSLNTLTDFERARYHLLRAHFFAMDKNSTVAKSHLDRALSHGDNALMLDALFIQELMKGQPDEKNPKNRQKRIELLENVRFYRRQDAFEKNLLLELAQLYESDGRLEDALFLLRQLLDYFPGTPEKREARLIAENIVCRLIHDKRDAPALKVLGIYAKYQDLAPTDHRKWALNLMRADQYIDLDLLDYARPLLIENQKNPDLPHDLAVKGAIRLAFMDYRGGRFQQALTHLSVLKDDTGDIPPTLARQALFLKAHLFIGLKRPGDALSLLRTDGGDDSLYFQVQILRSLKQWTAARDLLQSMIDNAQKTQKPVDIFIVQLAATLSQLGNRDEIANFRNRYDAAMTNSPHRDLFRLFTQTPNNTAPNHPALLDHLKQAEDFDQLLRRLQGNSVQ